MEVEVKLRIPDAGAHRRVTDVLAPFHVKTHRQENHFFDGSAGELSALRAVLRLRFSDKDPSCVVTLKAKAVLVDGISRVEEDEEVLDPSIGRDCAAEPAKLSAVESRVVRRAREEFAELSRNIIAILISSIFTHAHVNDLHVASEKEAAHLWKIQAKGIFTLSKPMN